MTTQRWFAAAVGLLVALVIAGILLHRPTVRDDAATPAAAPPASRLPPPPMPTLVATPEPDLPAAGPPSPNDRVRVDGVTFARRYADELCACLDGACIDAVNQRAGQSLGRAAASRDARAIRDNFHRAMTCAHDIRSRDPAPGPS